VKNEWKNTFIAHTTPTCAQRQLYPYQTVEKIKCKRFQNTFFTDARIQNLLPDLEKKKRVSAGTKKETVQ
jgi:hypothetical protein